MVSEGALLRFLRSHPVVLLLLLTPGIPEYLSSSSAINAVVLDPPLFIFQLVANLGLYGSGALLVYEAKVRWRKGWASVLLLGGAYGILEEGVALSTLFDPKAGPVGALGVYGHWYGVNWVWAAGIVPFHALFSISLPILLLGIALPETVGRSLLSMRRVAVAAGVLMADVVALMVVVTRLNGYWMGVPILTLSLVSIGMLILTARRVPAGALAPLARPHPSSNKVLVLVGVAFFPAVLLTQGAGEATLPAAADFVLVLAVQALFLLFAVRRAGLRDNGRGAISFALGLLVPIAVFGVLAELVLPLTLVLDAALAFFFRALWRETRPGQEARQAGSPSDMVRD